MLLILGENDEEYMETVLFMQLFFKCKITSEISVLEK